VAVRPNTFFTFNAGLSSACVELSTMPSAAALTAGCQTIAARDDLREEDGISIEQRRERPRAGASRRHGMTARGCRHREHVERLLVEIDEHRARHPLQRHVAQRRHDDAFLHLVVFAHVVAPRACAGKLAVPANVQSLCERAQTRRLTLRLDCGARDRSQSLAPPAVTAR
jgi:hypothetical protein